MTTGNHSDPAPGGDPNVTAAAAAIMDVWMGGDKSWRQNIDKADVLGLTLMDSADWQMAMTLAQAALSASPVSETPPADADVIAALRRSKALCTRIIGEGGPHHIVGDARNTLATLTRLEASQPASSGSEGQPDFDWSLPDPVLEAKARAAGRAVLAAVSDGADNLGILAALRRFFWEATPPRDLAAAPGGEEPAFSNEKDFTVCYACDQLVSFGCISSDCGFAASWKDRAVRAEAALARATGGQHV